MPCLAKPNRLMINDVAAREFAKRLGSGLRGLILTRNVRWSLSLRGKIVGMLALLLFVFVSFRELYPILAYSERIDCDTLVVDGAMPVHLLPLAADEYRSRPYHQVWVVHGIYL